MIDFIKSDTRFHDIDYKLSYTDKIPFTEQSETKKGNCNPYVKLKKSDFNATYLEPNEWNELLKDDDVIIIDTRNKYETAIGTFKNSIDPGTESFREFPEFVNNNLNHQKDKKIAMFCTGGIR